MLTISQPAFAIYFNKKAPNNTCLAPDENTLTRTILKEPFGPECFRKAKLLSLFSRHSLPAIEGGFNENMNDPKGFGSWKPNTEIQVTV